MNIIIRFIEKYDIYNVYDLRKEAQKYLGTLLLNNSDKQEEWYEKIKNDKTKLYLIIEEKHQKFNKFIGYIRLTEIDYINRSICVGADIKTNYRGKGYGKEVYKYILNFVFNELNMNKCYLWVLENNERAINLYKKIGFKESGKSRKAIYKNGRYINYIFMDLLKDEYINNEIIEITKNINVNIKDLDPEINKIIDENFEDLLL